MTRRIRFEDLTVQTSGDRAIYRFAGTVTPVIGPVGSGKTSLLELLKYALGGGAALSNTVKQAVQAVVLRVTFPSQTLVFARRIGAPTVAVHDADGTWSKRSRRVPRSTTGSRRSSCLKQQSSQR
jgi:ABC-type Mn2+/Zn2+ transport system ATPase subunit